MKGEAVSCVRSETGLSTCRRLLARCGAQAGLYVANNRRISGSNASGTVTTT